MIYSIPANKVHELIKKLNEYQGELEADQPPVVVGVGLFLAPPVPVAPANPGNAFQCPRCGDTIHVT